MLTSNLEIEPTEVYRAGAALDLGRLRQLTGLARPDLKDRPFVPQAPQLALSQDEDFFAAIRSEDILLHHPFDSFQPVVEFLQRAARDPGVLAIKMTLYRLGRDSPVVDALLEAIRNGKQVAVVVELQARFDEKSNIEWARTLEREGVHVVHGLPGLKVHSKVALVVRREGDTIRRYLHLATGNYNPTTARLYTDMGMFTCDPDIGADATALFNYLTGYSGENRFRKLLVAPVNLRERLAELIQREIDYQRSGQRGRLIFKMNGLDDPGMIRLLYEASCAGVQVDLLVRGICCLRPGIPGVSENIRVTSIVGRFLEHSRIFCFRNGGNEEIYLGSADLMPRNLNRRVEVLFPVSAPRLVARLRDEILGAYVADDAGARHMRSEGSALRGALPWIATPWSRRVLLSRLAWLSRAPRTPCANPFRCWPPRWRSVLPAWSRRRVGACTARWIPSTGKWNARWSRCRPSFEDNRKRSPQAHGAAHLSRLRSRPCGGLPLREPRRSSSCAIAFRNCKRIRRRKERVVAHHEPGARDHRHCRLPPWHPCARAADAEPGGV